MTIEKLGYQPIKPYLAKIDALTDAKSVVKLEGEFNKINHFFIASFYIGSDQKNSGMNILNFSQTGIGLPDRDYYFKTDAAT
ncbi:M13 family metallopeptidase N-terminal domain-containing protein, partial [Acinetobacter baumannii]